MAATYRQPGNTAQFEVVDGLAVVGPYRDRPPGTPYSLEDLIEEHHRFGIGHRLVLDAESRDGVPDQGNGNITRQTLMRDDTATIWTALPSRRFGAQTVDRFMGDAQTAGVAMFALFPDTHGHHLAPWANQQLYAAMERMRLPLVLDAGNAQGAAARTFYGEVHAIATTHTQLPIIIWNAFYMDERLQIPLLDACRNVRIGLATVFIPTFGIEQYTERYGPDRLIFGSNWPRQSPGPMLTYVLYADVHDRVKHAILGDTIRSLADDVRWPVRGLTRMRPTEPTAAPGDVAAAAAGAPPQPDAALAPESPPRPVDVSAPWLEAMAELEARSRRADADAPDGKPHDPDDTDGALDPRRAPGEEGE